MKNLRLLFVGLLVLILGGCSIVIKNYEWNQNSDNGAINTIDQQANGASVVSETDQVTRPKFKLPINIENPLEQLIPNNVDSMLEIIEPVIESAKPTNELTQTERGKLRPDRPNANRPQWYFSKLMKFYGDEFKISFCGKQFVVPNTNARFERGQFLVKQSDVVGRGMVVLGPSTCLGGKAVVKY